MKKRFMFEFFIIAIALIAAFAIQTFYNPNESVSVLLDGGSEIKQVEFVNLQTSMVKKVEKTRDINEIVKQLNKISNSHKTNEIETISNWSYRIIFDYEDGKKQEASVLEDKVFMNGTYYEIGNEYTEVLGKLYDSIAQMEEEWIG